MAYKHFTKLKHSWDTQNENNNTVFIGIAEDYFDFSEKVRKTGDLAVCLHGNKVKHGEHFLYTEEFLDAIDKNLQAKLA